MHWGPPLDLLLGGGLHFCASWLYLQSGHLGHHHLRMHWAITSLLQKKTRMRRVNKSVEFLLFVALRFHGAKKGLAYG